jgi:polyferredoxin
MFVMWCGVGFAWMDNEPFAAFLFRTAPPVALTLALGFTILSMFVPRPYCRFVCPTGSLIKLAEK